MRRPRNGNVTSIHGHVDAASGHSLPFRDSRTSIRAGSSRVASTAICQLGNNPAESLLESASAQAGEDFMTSRSRELRALLTRGRVIQVPGVYDGLTARMAAEAGFEAISITG